jgi:hypothetical protein
MDDRPFGIDVTRGGWLTVYFILFYGFDVKTVANEEMPLRFLFFNVVVVFLYYLSSICT